MESADYDYGTSTAPQPYQYLGFGANVGLFSGVSNDGCIPTPGLEHPLDLNVFLSGAFDHSAVETSVSHGTGLTPLPTSPTSPPSQQLSLLPKGSVCSGLGIDMHSEQQGWRSSSEGKDSPTPAQSRRKAQNRAAQQAFRERKERHVRDLEANLKLLARTTSSLRSDNERLNLVLQRVQTQNEILRATVSFSPASNHPRGFVDDPRLLPHSCRQSKRPKVLAEETHLDTAKLTNRLLSTTSALPGKYGSLSGRDSQMLSASATWALLQSHPLHFSGAVDICDVCDRPKKMAKYDDESAVCHTLCTEGLTARLSMDPMLEEEEVHNVITDVGRSGGDALI
ncbi:hypothetical protein LTR56_027267 [Elasticomyces elasticus]|nr:hypothetical protein LTR56_027267 [Elasticomyces elasticus]KAK3627190.1 hypothetical protein LTR22_022872 [Elasticomyces elasticus]KAK4907454.1 hypothetical protein LTR49_023518 [Elasticomyces elasticus]